MTNILSAVQWPLQPQGHRARVLSTMALAIRTAATRLHPTLTNISTSLLIPLPLPIASQLRHYQSAYTGGSYNSYRHRRVLPTNTIIKFVPQQEAWLVERMGKFHRILDPGLAVLIPFLDSIKYVKSLKEVAIEIPSQSAITQDNVTLELDGVLYFKIIDAYRASYGIADHEYAMTQLAQTTMRAEIGQMTLDKTLAERTQLNSNIVHAINSAAQDWGIQCLRYEIRDIHPPDNVVTAMHQQVSAERRKRAEILESEGQRQAAINVAEGKKQSAILDSEAMKAKQVNEAFGEADAILLRAKATAESISRIASSIESAGSSGHDAVSLSIAKEYIEAWSKIGKEGTTVVVPSNMADAAGMVTSAMKMFDNVRRGSGLKTGNSGPSPAAAPASPNCTMLSSTTPCLSLENSKDRRTDAIHHNINTEL
ncbi:hypothetical protein SeMB42_g07034 [Synchytrium endobioticum]|uniref:Band 7 domain-containing protein n=1 Tax=Synchytrium endobioticum TaxID=286115 RepID=A0A507CGN5_9FUNG|nr:hypothetical protein SeMB42_g07036 [Synchytrium endobioticum]TPX36806.1 hypothetical protein SeMB42_g07038 [Synchytrium endobioticum]TPX36810.1 hypothetical protein SeMB42_g07034 [Synchytrium endobioticum]TPX38848.1 hypothetical protein SeLEV6574_g07580 [Synchytrium endobioticum]